MSEKHKWWHILIPMWRGLKTCWGCKYHSWGGYGDVSRCSNKKAYRKTNKCRELNNRDNCEYYKEKGNQ